MTETLLLAIIAGLAALAFIGSFLLRSQLAHVFSWPRTRPALLWLRLGLLVVALSACGGSALSAPAKHKPAKHTHHSTVTTTIPSTGNDWTTYHGNNLRTGYISTTPDAHNLTAAWKQPLDGAVYAEPLVVGNHIIVATEGDSLYALDPTTGTIQWHTSVGTPVPQSSLPCGDINPLGITSTPVYDPTSKLVFAVAEVSGPAHKLVGVNVDTGQIQIQRSADINGMDPRAHQQRSALALSNGMVYIAYGGLAGDCSDYIGRVVASRTDGQGPLLSYTVPTPREGGIWAPPGPTVDASGNLFVSVGNGEVTQGNWDHSDSILKLSPTLTLEDAFAPTNWGQENANDEDMASQSPVLLPNNFVFAAGKDNNGFTLHTNALGGVGGQVDEQTLCRSFGGAAVIGTTMFLPCTNGVWQVSVDSTGHIQKGWHAASNIVGSPVIGGHTLYVPSNGTLYALNTANGQVVASLNVGQNNRFATPTIDGTNILVGTLSGITAVKIS